MGHPLDGDWQGADGSVLRLATSQLPGTDYAEASGIYSAKNGHAAVTGFITAGDVAMTSRHAIALTFAETSTSTAIALSGVVDAAHGALRPFGLSNRPTSPRERYAFGYP